MYQSLIVIDDFYPDPHEVRRMALASDYPEVSGQRTYPGRNSTTAFTPPGLADAVSRVVGEPLEGIDDGMSSHGRFRITLAGETGRYRVHVDPTALTWVGVVYLNASEHCRGGTEFYRHRGLKSDRTPLSRDELTAYGQPSIAALLQAEGNDESRWEYLMTMPMRFNRLALYRPWLWHSAGAPFGDCLENGRLVQLVSFRAVGA
ncbi:MAG: DUF6445 family protein [Alphaproteobacteria bacterium]